MHVWEQIFDYVLDSVVVVDRKGEILYLNPAFENLFEASLKRTTGQDIQKVLQLKPDEWEKLGRLSAVSEVVPYHRFPYTIKKQTVEIGICLVPWPQSGEDVVVILIRDFSLETQLQAKYFQTMKQNEQIYKAHQKRLFEVLFLSAISEAADVATSSEELFEKFLPKIVEITEIDAIGFFLKEDAEKARFKGFATKRTVTRQNVEEIYESYKTKIDELKDIVEPQSFAIKEFQCALVPVIHKDQSVGFSIVIKQSTTPVSAEEMQMIWVMGEHIVAHLERIRLREDVLKDSLTQIHNTRFFQNRLAFELESHKKTASQMSLLLFDVDFFKKVNDTYGHQVGDLILKEVAQVAKKCLRTSDSLARIGGEEFAIILPQTPLESAKAVAERIRVAIENHVPDAKTPQLKVTSSFGISHCPTHGWEKNMVVQKADQALYEAKRTGRNKVVVAGA